MDHKKSAEKMQKPSQPYNTSSSIDSPIWGRCHVATETASHIHSESGLAEFRFRRLEKHFYGTKRL
jgi:hypothetical protein